MPWERRTREADLPGDPAGVATASGASAADLAYSQLGEHLRRAGYAPGSRILGERSLAAEIGVSRATLRQALTRLADEGVLQRSSQRGWFLPRRAVGEPPSVLQSFSEMARARGLRPTAHVLERSVRPATLTEAGRLRIAPSAPVLQLRRVRGMDEVPVCLEDSVLVAARTRALLEADLEDASLFEVLARLCDVAVSRSSYAIQAMGASPAQARLLDIPAGSPVLVGDEVTYDSNGVPVVSSRTVYRGDAYRFEADLFRPLSLQAPQAPQTPRALPVPR